MDSVTMIAIRIVIVEAIEIGFSSQSLMQFQTWRSKQKWKMKSLNVCFRRYG